MLMQFSLIDDRHVDILLELLQVGADQITQFFLGTGRLVHRPPKPLENLLRLVFVKLDQDIIFILEIEIYCAVCNSRSFGDL